MEITTASQLNCQRIKTALGHTDTVAEFREKMAVKHTVNFYTFLGVDYDGKADRYKAVFSSRPRWRSLRKFSVRCSEEVVDFLLRHAHKRRCQWFLTVKSGTLTDVDIFDYNF